MNRLLLIIVLLGTLIRMINLTQPLLEGASTRQVQTAMVAKNYYTQGFRLFYPQVDKFGKNPGYYMFELYIIQFIIALFYKLAGGTHEWMLRLSSIFFYIAAVIMLYKLAVYYFNKKIGLIAAFCFTVSPISIYLGRAVHPEMAMIFFNMGAIYFFSRYIYENKLPYGLLASFSFMLSVLLKLPNLYLFMPLIFIAYTRFGLGLFKLRRLWVLFFIFIIPVASFNYFQHLVRITYPNPTMEAFTIEVVLKYLRIYLSSNFFYKKVFDDLVTYTLTPIGFTLFIASLLVKIREKKKYVFYCWLLSIGIFFLLMPAQCIQGYYHIHLLPVICIFIARFIFSLSETQFYRDKFVRFSIPLFLICLFAAVFRYSFAYYRIPENFQYVVETGKAIDRLTDEDALVVASIENGPDLLYYANRRGWTFAIEDPDSLRKDVEKFGVTPELIYDRVKYLEYLRSKGADYFASASMEEFLGNTKFSSYLFDNYNIVDQSDHYIIFDLRHRKLNGQD